MRHQKKPPCKHVSPIGEKCPRPLHARGYCASHDRRNRLGLPMNEIIRRYTHGGAPCYVMGCSLRAVAFGLCGAHRDRQIQGKPLEAPKKRNGAKGVLRASIGKVLPRYIAALDARAKARGMSRSAMMEAVLEMWMRDFYREAA